MYFVVGTAGVGYAAVAKNAVVGLLSSWAPAADVLAVSTIEVDLSAIAEGSSVTVKYRGKPLFIRHRPQSDILPIAPSLHLVIIFLGLLGWVFSLHAHPSSFISSYISPSLISSPFYVYIYIYIHTQIY